MNPLTPIVLAAIFLGGGFGSVTRHIFGVWLNGRTTLPWGTLLALSLIHISEPTRPY